MVENTVFFQWDTPDTEQFDFLLKLMSQITNNQLTGSYCSYDKNWAVST